MAVPPIVFDVVAWSKRVIVRKMALLTCWAYALGSIPVSGWVPDFASDVEVG
jgi:hypothetical protein